MLGRIGFAFAIAAAAAVSAPASAANLESHPGVLLRGPNDSWELCQSRRCLRLLQSLRPTDVRRTDTPAKRQRSGYSHRRAYRGAPYHRPHYRPRYSGYDDAGHYWNRYSYGCSIVFIPYGWTWYRAISCQ